MIQIIGLLLCIYLIFKGFEILQVGMASAREDRRAVIIYGVFAFIASIVIAGIFAAWLISAGASMGNRATYASLA